MSTVAGALQAARMSVAHAHATRDVTDDTANVTVRLWPVMTMMLRVKSKQNLPVFFFSLIHGEVFIPLIQPPVTPGTRTKFAEHSFCFASPDAWNSLPSHLHFILLLMLQLLNISLKLNFYTNICPLTVNILLALLADCLEQHFTNSICIVLYCIVFWKADQLYCVIH